MRALASWVLVTAGTVLLAVIVLAANKEYKYWAPRVSAVLLNLATYAIPRTTRDARRAEWLAELDLLAEEGHGLVFALTVLVLSPRTSLADRRNPGIQALPSETAPPSGAAYRASSASVRKDGVSKAAVPGDE